MKKPWNLVKSSFSLLETIISITLLSIIISGFLNTSYYDNQTEQINQKLNSLENLFFSNNYKNLNQKIEHLEIKIDNKTEVIYVKKYTYEDDELKVVKYEK